MRNLAAQIEGLEARADRALPVPLRAELIELVAQRGQILGLIAEAERAEALSEQLALDHPQDGSARLSRARSRGRFHRFSEALDDLDRAETLGAETIVVQAERGAIFQAVGEYDRAFALLADAAAMHPDMTHLGSLAVFHAERGETELAESLFDRSWAAYRGVSPIPLALLSFQRGHMWMSGRDRERARSWFELAVRLVPAYAPAQGHLAEVEAALGDVDAAVPRLLPLTSSSDDPDYASALAVILRRADRKEEAASYLLGAGARYEALLARHPDAFADHAAAFWLENGDARRALALAERNFALRQTNRARRLLERAAMAVRKQGLDDEERA
jgi:tetratricopeptide (TPR) repeat protein